MMILCTAGSYCPVNSSIPILCLIGTYCPAGSAGPTLCPFGMYAITSVSLRVSINNSCLSCPRGTYGTDSLRLSCAPCKPGYVCLGETKSDLPSNSTDNGYICPAGYYCPEGSFYPIPCESGYYNGAVGAYNISVCVLCPSGSFNILSGQATCTPCGASATSFGGTSSCTCLGYKRAYQVTDGSCLCQPGYEYYGILFFLI